jgi:hypothetical protein
MLYNADIETSKGFVMRKLLMLMPLVLFTACASNKGLDRMEVIKASRECVNAHMKPVIQYLPQKTDQGTVTLPVYVSCEVYAATLK